MKVSEITSNLFKIEHTPRQAQHAMQYNVTTLLVKR